MFKLVAALLIAASASNFIVITEKPRLPAFMNATQPQKCHYADPL